MLTKMEADLVAAYREALDSRHKDPHKFAAAKHFQVQEEHVTPIMRREVKTLALRLAYSNRGYIFTSTKESP